MPVYKWKPFVSVSSPAQAVGEELTQISAERDGRLDADEVWKIAKRRKSSVLHNEFEWNVEKAARKHWKERAQYLIRSIVMVTNEGVDDEDDKVIRVFISSVDDLPGYIESVRVISDKEMRQKVLARAWKELQDWTKRYQDFEEFASLFVDIKKHKR